MVLKVLSYSIALAVGIFMFCPNDVSGIWCYQCNSEYHGDCRTPANDSTHLRLCVAPTMKPNHTGFASFKPVDPNQMFCRKIYQKIHDRGGLEVVVRGCGWKNDTRDCYRTSNMGHQQVVCQCFKDGCNSAGKSAISAAALILTSGLAFLFH